ncbi:hypothetical protein ACFL1Q_00060 [Patescibacteria group bacterium]
MKKAIYISILILILVLISPKLIRAEANVAERSALLKSQISQDSYDIRVEILKNYLQKHNSPLADYAKELVDYADTYELDWRMVAAISGVESTFGKRIPQGSYNAYGWANGNYQFESWDDSIEIVSKTLKEKYIEKGAVSISQIARRYAPPSSTWSYKVKYFMNKIDPLAVSFTLEV